MKKIIKQLLILFCLITVLILPYFVFAETDALKHLNIVATEGGPYAPATENSIAQIAGLVVKTLFSILGIIFIVLTIYGGYNYMTARGEEEKVSKALDTIKRAVIGLIIILASYAIWNFIFTKFIL